MPNVKLKKIHPKTLTCNFYMLHCNIKSVTFNKIEFGMIETQDDL